VLMGALRSRSSRPSDDAFRDQSMDWNEPASCRVARASDAHTDWRLATEHTVWRHWHRASSGHQPHPNVPSHLCLASSTNLGNLRMHSNKLRNRKLKQYKLLSRDGRQSAHQICYWRSHWRKSTLSVVTRTDDDKTTSMTEMDSIIKI